MSSTVTAALMLAFSASATTIHRSFLTREAGVAFGTGMAGVAYPVDAKVDKAIDEARQKDQPYGKESTSCLASLIRGQIARFDFSRETKNGKHHHGRRADVVFVA